MINIFYDDRNKVYLCADINLICSFCEKPLIINETPGFYYKINYWRNKTEEIIICNKCILDSKNSKKLKPKTNIEEVKYIILVNLIPHNSRIVLPQKPDLINKNFISNVDACYLPSESVKDRTVLAGRPEGYWEGVSIGKDITKELEQKDKPIKKIEDGLKYIEMLKDSKPLITKKEETKLNKDLN